MERFSALMVTLGILAVGCSGCAPSREGALVPADLVLKGGRIVTVDEDRPEAEALAIRDRILVAVGTTEEIEPFVGDDTRVLDLQGALAVPGFIEGHGHFLGLGQSRMILDLTTARSWEEIVEQVAGAVAETEPGEWIRGRGWHQDKWEGLPPETVDGVPTHVTLSEVSPENPVLLVHASGHGAIANARALEMAGVTGETPDPEGGTIVRDPGGRATGYLRETAQNLVDPGEPSEADLRQAVALAGEESLRKGVTSFQDAGTPVERVELLRTMAAEGELPVRLWMMIRDENETIRRALPELIARREAEAHFTVGGLKRSIDGALGSHGAWLLEPYEDLPGSTGLNTTDIETIEESGRIALEHDLQLCVHAIGDRANRETLDLFQRVTEEAGTDLEILRWRVEHAQHLHPDDIPRFAELGVIASVQAVHCTSDGPWVPERLGEDRAASGAYVWRDLLDSGAIVSNGTDTPVEDVDPIANFHAAVTREMANGERFHPEQRMTREEALWSMTLAAAYAAEEEEIKGSITPGKLADIAILSRDILSVPEDEIRDAEVLHTIVGGEIRYSRD